MVVPVGFRFNPTDEELLNAFLWPKIMGQRLVSEFVEEKQLYGPGANPWDVLLHDGSRWVDTERDGHGQVVKKTTYVFTKLKKKAKTQNNNGAKVQFVRTAGCGVWLGQSSSQVKNRDGRVIGNDRMLVFTYLGKKPSLNPNPNPGHWIMHEFSLPNGEYSDYVVCEIVLDLRKTTKMMKRGLVIEEDGNEDERVFDDIDHPAKRLRKNNMNEQQVVNHGIPQPAAYVANNVMVHEQGYHSNNTSSTNNTHQSYVSTMRTQPEEEFREWVDGELEGLLEDERLDDGNKEDEAVIEIRQQQDEEEDDFKSLDPFYRAYKQS